MKQISEQILPMNICALFKSDDDAVALQQELNRFSYYPPTLF